MVLACASVCCHLVQKKICTLIKCLLNHWNAFSIYTQNSGKLQLIFELAKFKKKFLSIVDLCLERTSASQFRSTRSKLSRFIYLENMHVEFIHNSKLSVRVNVSANSCLCQWCIVVSSVTVWWPIQGAPASHQKSACCCWGQMQQNARIIYCIYYFILEIPNTTVYRQICANHFESEPVLFHYKRVLIIIFLSTPSINNPL